jgi:hypothetical protein
MFSWKRNRLAGNKKKSSETMMLVYALVAVAVFFQCANVYVMYFIENMRVGIPAIEARLPSTRVVDVETGEEVEARWLTRLRCACWPLIRFNRFVDENVAFGRVWERFCMSLSFMLFGTMMVGAALLFGLGMKHYSATGRVDAFGVVFYY